MFQNKLEERISSLFIHLLAPIAKRALRNPDVKLTPREFEVMACLLVRRNLDPTISELLLISKRTVETHIRNISLKLKCTPRTIHQELSSAAVYECMSSYYRYLLSNLRLVSTLKETQKIKSLHSHLFIKVAYVFPEGILNYVREQMGIADINIEFIFVRNSQKRFFSHSKAQIYTNFDSKKSVATIAIRENNVKIENYPVYRDIILFLVEVSKGKESVEAVKRKYVWQSTDIQTSDKQRVHQARPQNRTNIRWIVAGIGFLIILLSCILIINLAAGNVKVVRTELNLPLQTETLPRTKLMSEIHNKLYNPDNSKAHHGISYLLVAGVAGAGKTILAKRIAHKHRGLIWFINSENSRTLHSSILDLAYAMATTDAARKKLQFILDIKEADLQKKQVMQFVRSGLKKKPGWLLIYDNASKGILNSKNLPTDKSVCGSGVVLVTSRQPDAMSFLGVEVVNVPALSPSECSALFFLIADKHNANIKPRNDLQSFIEKIPPFPLDIVLVAKYLNHHHMTYQDFLGMLQQKNANISINETILNKGNARNTFLYSSLDNLSNKRQFRELLVMASLLDPSRIPTKVLHCLANSLEVGEFLQELYSLSIISPQEDTSISSSFAVSKSIHEDICKYIMQRYSHEERNQYVKKCIEAFEGYVYGKLHANDFQELRRVLVHINHIQGYHSLSLAHKSVVTLIRSDIATSIPPMQRELIPKLEGALTNFKDQKITKLNNLRKLRVLSILGDRYRSMCEFEKSFQAFSQAIAIASKLFPSSIDTAVLYTRLGILERTIGHNDTAQELFEKSNNIMMRLNNQFYRSDIILGLALNARDTGQYEMAEKHLKAEMLRFKGANEGWYYWLKLYLATVYLDSDLHNKALQTLLPAEKYYGKDSELRQSAFTAAWRFAYISAAKTRIIPPKAAEKLLLEAESKFIELSNGRKPHGIVFKVIYPYLAEVYMAQSRYTLAEQTLLESCKYLESQYGKDGVQPAKIKTRLGNLYLKQNKFNAAESCYNEALVSYTLHNHIDQYKAYEGLGELAIARATNNLQLNTVAIQHFEKALSKLYEQKSIMHKHILRIRTKLRRCKGRAPFL